MGVDRVAVTLLAERKDLKNITSDQFIDRLNFESLKEDFAIRSNAGSNGRTSAVNISPISMADFEDDVESAEDFYRRLYVQLENTTVWLDSQSQSTFEKMRRDGLTVSLFVDLVLSSNQIELHLPHILLAACARLELEIDINSF